MINGHPLVVVDAMFLKKLPICARNLETRVIKHCVDGVVLQ